MTTVLQVAVDFASSAAWLAVEPTRALAREFALTLDWHALVRPIAARPASATVTDSRGARHRDLRATYLENDVRRYAGDRGVIVDEHLSYAFPTVDTTLAAAGLLYLRDHRPDAATDYVEAVFALVFGGPGTPARRAGLATINDIADLVAGVAGVPQVAVSAYLTSSAAALAAHQEILTAQGIGQSPTYQLADERFIGRAQLPFLRWRLSGEQSPRPI